MAASETFPCTAQPVRRPHGPSACAKNSSNLRATDYSSKKSGSIEIRNPRALFPVRDDFIRSAWVQRARTKRAQEYEELYPYFPFAAVQDAAGGVAPCSQLPDEKGPETVVSHQIPRAASYARSHHMGVGSGPRNVVELRRAFRRLEPEKMFRAPRVEGEPIWAYWGGDSGEGRGQSRPPLPQGKRVSTTEGFVLLPAKELTELRALEGALRHERSVLNSHCLLALNKGEVSAHRPLEATRMAVHDACRREMADALREYRVWTGARRGTCGDTNVARFSDNNRRTRDYRGRDGATFQAHHVSNKSEGTGKRARKAASEETIAMLERTPTGWRTLRWLMTKRRAELRRQAAEAEQMFTEEMEQRHKDRYLEAWERRHDYDLYCVLAGQFWALDGEDFRSVTRPGRKLFLEIDAPARVITRMWKTCWPLRKGRKRKGCQALQALWRGHRVRQRWRPIIRLRIRHGRRAFMRPCFNSWSRLTRVHKWARSRFKEMEGRWTRSCFDAWAGWTADLAAEKLQKLERAARTLKNVAAYRVFRSWKGYTRGARRARNLFARIIGGPTLHAWIRYMDEARVDRKRSNAAVVIQQHARGYLMRLRYRATRRIIRGINRLMGVRKARNVLHKALALAHQRAAEELLQHGRDFEISIGITREDRRLAKRQKELSMVEAAVRRQVTRRLNAGWLSTARFFDAARGGGELQREIKLVREEWKALEDSKRNNTSNAKVRKGGRTGVLSKTGIRDRLKIGVLGGLTRPSGGGGDDGGGRGPGMKEEPFDAVEHERALQGEGRTNLGYREIAGVDGELSGNTSVEVNPFAATTPPPRSAPLAVTTTATRKKATKNDAKNDAEAAEREARRRILSREQDLAREITTHNFDACNPPPLSCCAPGCDRTFTRGEHYLAHWGARSYPPDSRQSSLVHETPHGVGGVKTAAASLGSSTVKDEASHAEEGHPTLGNEAIASFHLVVGSQVDGKSHHEMDDCKDASSGFDLVSAYITRTWGHGQAYYTLLFWDAVNSWRRHLTTSTAYFREAVALRRLYLDPAAPRQIYLPKTTRQDLLCVLDTLPGLDDTGTMSPDGADDDVVEESADGGGGGESVGDTATGTLKDGRVVPAGLDERFWHEKTKAGKHGPKNNGDRQQQQREAASSSIAAALASASSSVGLRPTSFDEAQWHALAHLCRVVGPGFGMSDLGQRASDIRSKDLKRKRKAAFENVRLERKSRFMNEAAEINKHLKRSRELREDALAEPALDAVSDSVIDAVLRSAVSRLEILKMRELEATQEEEMLAEAATIEAVWVVEPPLLDYLLVEEIGAYCAERAERELMSLEDEGCSFSTKNRGGGEEENRLALSTATMLENFDLNAIPGGEEGACAASTTIGLAWRQRAARIEARRNFARVYVKRPAPGGGVYYEHTVAGESQWERPLIAARLFPNSSW